MAKHTEAEMASSPGGRELSQLIRSVRLASLTNAIRYAEYVR